MPDAGLDVPRGAGHHAAGVVQRRLQGGIAEVIGNSVKVAGAGTPHLTELVTFVAGETRQEKKPR